MLKYKTKESLLEALFCSNFVPQRIKKHEEKTITWEY
jgi:hypothetical protein